MEKRTQTKIGKFSQMVGVVLGALILGTIALACMAAIRFFWLRIW